MAETDAQRRPNRLETSQVGLTLLEMTTVDDDQAYFDLQNANIEYWKEYGNTIDSSLAEVTARRLDRSDGRYGIWHESELVGMVGCSAKKNPGEAEVGVLLAKDAAGHGYATAAVRALTDFIKPQFDRVFAEAAPDNTKSIEMLERSGYQTNGAVIERDWGRALVFEAPK